MALLKEPSPTSHYLSDVYSSPMIPQEAPEHLCPGKFEECRLTPKQPPLSLLWHIRSDTNAQESSICSPLILLKPPFQGLKGETDATSLYPQKEERKKAYNITLRNASYKFLLLNIQHCKPLYPLVFEISIL